MAYSSRRLRRSQGAGQPCRQNLRDWSSRPSLFTHRWAIASSCSKSTFPNRSPRSRCMSPAERKAAMAKAAIDAQAIFREDCAKCHIDKGAKAYGQDLYAADCGICHESPHRDTAVPDLHALKHPTDLDYWTTIIRLGKPHTMMPGFAVAQGGPLSDEQIASLASYLNRTISHNLPPAPRPPPTRSDRGFTTSSPQAEAISNSRRLSRVAAKPAAPGRHLDSNVAPADNGLPPPPAVPAGRKSVPG